MSDQLAQVLAEGRPPVNGLLQRVLDFVAALRRAGVGATQSEAIDAFRTIPHLDLLEREQLREGLASVTVTSQTHRRAFDDLFELYFPARRAVDDDTPDVTDDPPDPEGGDGGFEDLLDALMRGGDEAIRRMARQAVDEFGRVEGRDGGASYFQYKVFRAVDLQQLLKDLLARAQDESDRPLTALQERLHRDEFEARLRTFEVVPEFVEVEGAVPRLRPAWW